MARIEPLGVRVLVRRLETKTETEGGIIIPDSAQEPPIEGTVVAVSPYVGEHGYLSVGDHVYFSKYSGNEVSLNGEVLILILEADIQARLVDD